MMWRKSIVQDDKDWAYKQAELDSVVFGITFFPLQKRIP